MARQKKAFLIVWNDFVFLCVKKIQTFFSSSLLVHLTILLSDGITSFVILAADVSVQPIKIFGPNKCLRAFFSFLTRLKKRSTPVPQFSRPSNSSGQSAMLVLY